jgi:hypothetical protein
VLEKHLPRSRYKQPGERVVQGQRTMQAASDIFLGCTAGAQAGRHHYWRQLRDMKGAAQVEAMIPTGSPSTPGCAVGRSPARTPAQGTRSHRRISG